MHDGGDERDDDGEGRDDGVELSELHVSGLAELERGEFADD